MRVLSKRWQSFINVVCVTLVLFQVYTSGFGIKVDILQRSIHLGFVLLLTFILKPPSKKVKRKNNVPVYDLILAALSVLCCGYAALMWRAFIASPMTWNSVLDNVFAILLVILVMEASRRAVGMIFPLLGIFFFIYAHFGQIFPGVWGHKNFSIDFIFQTFYHTTNGIWGQMLSISSTMLAMFGIFGAMLSATGGANTFIKLGKLLTGKSTGGAGKVSIVASGLFGMISGSAVANVVATGTFTIPMMKDSRYNNEWSGAICAVASTGGQIMPPIMGAAAFIMCQIIGVTYLEIATCALLPALLYYYGTFVATHYFSKKKGIGGMEMNEKINLLEYLVIFAPIVVFVALLVMGFSVTNAAFYATMVGLIVTIFTFFFDGQGTAAQVPARSGKLLFSVAKSGAFSIIDMASLLAGAQITITLISMSGFAVKLSDMIVSVGQNSLFLCLILSMLVCLILGMGVPTTAAYVLGSAILATALTSLGMEPLVAHLFIFYFACLSAITPPVCSAVFLSAGLAEAKWLQTGFLSCLLALPAFIIPFTFAYNKALLLQGPFVEVLVAVLTAVIGVFAFGIAVAGYFKRGIKMPVRILLFVSGLLLIVPSYFTAIIGAIILAAFMILDTAEAKKGARHAV